MNCKHCNQPRVYHGADTNPWRANACPAGSKFPTYPKVPGAGMLASAAHKRAEALYRVGYAFWGCDFAERAARFFESWIARNAGAGSYDAQRSIAFEGAFTFHAFDNGASGWSRDRKLADWEAQAMAAAIETRRGFAVSTRYYPCAD